MIRCILGLAHLVEMHPCEGADACIYQEPAAYCKGLPFSFHKQALLAVLEIAIISMVRAAHTEGRIMTLRIKGQKEVS